MYAPFTKVFTASEIGVAHILLAGDRKLPPYGPSAAYLVSVSIQLTSQPHNQNFSGIFVDWRMPIHENATNRFCRENTPCVYTQFDTRGPCLSKYNGFFRNSWGSERKRLAYQEGDQWAGLLANKPSCARPVVALRHHWSGSYKVRREKVRCVAEILIRGKP